MAIDEVVTLRTHVHWKLHSRQLHLITNLGHAQLLWLLVTCVTMLQMGLQSQSVTDDLF